MDASVDLRAKLAVIHHLKERMLRRRSDEPGAALSILPDGGDIPAKTIASGSGLERGIGLAPLLRRPRVERGIEKHGQDGGPSDIQIGDGNRTI